MHEMIKLFLIPQKQLRLTSAVDSYTVVLNPTTPMDNLLKLNFDQRVNFKKIFRQMLKEVEQAIKTKSNKVALNIWKQQFGDKFPVA